jgi:hypothetical protein
MADSGVMVMTRSVKRARPVFIVALELLPHVDGIRALRRGMHYRQVCPKSYFRTLSFLDFGQLNYGN